MQFCKCFWRLLPIILSKYHVAFWLCLCINEEHHKSYCVPPSCLVTCILLQIGPDLSSVALHLYTRVYSYMSHCDLFNCVSQTFSHIMVLSAALCVCVCGILIGFTYSNPSRINTAWITIFHTNYSSEDEDARSHR